ncbi:MAG: helix-turn-helix domain-containing protein [Hyphomicrobiales bacterium]
MANTLTLKIASRLKKLRGAREWSLDDLARKSSISRATLSRLEKGETSPTAEVLGKLCTAYNITMSRLLAMVEENFPALVAREEQAIWQDPQTGFTRRVVSPPGGPLAAEVLLCELKPGTRIEYDNPPVKGLEHHLVMLDGGLDIVVDGTKYELKAGDCLRYQLNGTSIFITPADAHAEYVLCLV